PDRGVEVDQRGRLDGSLCGTIEAPDAAMLGLSSSPPAARLVEGDGDDPRRESLDPLTPPRSLDGLHERRLHGFFGEDGRPAGGGDDPHEPRVVLPRTLLD